jgi:hypothetical protein
VVEPAIFFIARYGGADPAGGNLLPWQVLSTIGAQREGMALSAQAPNYRLDYGRFGDSAVRHLAGIGGRAT